MILRVVCMPKQKKTKMPPLSFVDKLIYCFLYLIIIVITFSLFHISEWVRTFTAFTDDHVFAVTAGTSSLLSLIPTFAVFSTCIYFWAVNYKERRPIFRKKGINYGEQNRNIYPLFTRQHKPKSVNDLNNKKRLFKQFGFAPLAIILALSFFIGAFGIYSRYELTNVSVIKYNWFNQVSDQYPLDTVTRIEIDAYHYNQYRSSGHYTFSYTFFFDNGKTIRFDYSEFRDLESLKIIDSTLRAIPRKISGIKNLNPLRREYHFNDQDWAIIQNLFST